MNNYNSIASRPSTNSSLLLQVTEAHHHQVSSYRRTDSSQSRVAVQTLTSQAINSEADYLDFASPGGADKKRSDRKYFSPEKLARVRERDAFRKRLERLNMSAEKRRDLRSKDRARKAAIRMQKKITEEQGQLQGYTSHDFANIRPAAASTATRESRRDGQGNTHFPGQYRQGKHLSSALQPESGTRVAPNCTSGDFRKISVNSLLN